MEVPLVLKLEDHPRFLQEILLDLRILDFARAVEVYFNKLAESR